MEAQNAGFDRGPAGRRRERPGRVVMAVGSLLIGLIALIPACAPAPVRPAGRPIGGSTLPLSGVYEARLSAPFLGTFTGLLVAEPTREGFRANTRPGAAWTLIGGIEGLLGPIFMPYLFPGGVILSWSSALPTTDGPGEGWLGPGGLQRYGVRTLTDTPDGPVRLVLPDGRAVALLTLRPAPPDRPHDDYPEVARRMEDALRTRLFAPPVAGRQVAPAGLGGYLEQLHSAAATAQDDIEFAFGAAMAARNNLRFLPLPLRWLDPGAGAILRSWSEDDLATVRASLDTQTRIATVKAELFLETADVDLALGSALETGPRAVIFDLRNCQGVELSALRVLAWLSDEETDAGTFYGPGGESGAAILRLQSASDFDIAGTRLDEAGSLRLQIAPMESPFLGRVAVLTNRRTAGSAEALVAILRASGRATIVGESTAGRIVLSRPVDVGQGWILRMPGAGWTSPGGTPAGTKGIEPDVRAAPEAAPARAAEWLTRPDEGP